MRFHVDWLWSKLKDSHLEELVRGALGFFNLRLLGTIGGYIFLYLVSHWYGPEVVGIYALSIAALRIALLYGRMGLDNALVRFIAEYTAKGRKEFVKQVYIHSLGASILSSLGISLLLYFSAPLLAKVVFSKPTLVTTLRIIAMVILPGTILHINASILRGLKRTASYSFLINASQFLLGSLILILGKPFLEGSSAPVIAFAAATAAASLISFGFRAIPRLDKVNVITKIEKQDTGNIETQGEAIRIWSLMKVAFPMLLTGSYWFFLNWTGILVLGIYRSEAEVGIYNIAVKIATILTYTLNSVNSIAASKFSECYSSGDMEGFRKVTRYATRMIFWTTIPIAFLLITFPTPISGFFGEEIKGGATALVILVVGYLTNAISGPVGTILNMTGHQMAFQKIVLNAAVINILLNFILIPRFGINGSAVASTVTMCLWNIISVIYVKKKFNVLTLYIPFVTQRRGTS